MTDLDRPVEFSVSGQRFQLSGREVLDRARDALAGDIPPEAHRYKEWAVDVDGQIVGVKWLFSLATGLGVRQFKTGDARRILPRLGIKVQSTRETMAPVPGDRPIQAPQIDAMSRHEFLDQVAHVVQAHLPPHLTPSAVRNRNNYLQITYPDFRVSHLHYEVYLLKSRHEVALHFESSPELNLAWLAHFESEMVSLSQSLGHTVQAERWGRKWGHVTVSLSPRRFTPPWAQEIGTLMARFIQVTYPTVQKALAAAPLPSRASSRRRVKSADDPERRYALLNAEVHAIRDFLQGNSGSRPSDERLCYWVFLCLTFELYREGWQLFTLVDPSQVPNTLYERTRRFAQACQVRVEVQA